MSRTPNSPTFEPRLNPPASVPAPVKAIFVAITRAVSADHFSAADLPLLVEYARAAHQADVAAAKLEAEGAVVDGRASPWLVVQEKAVRALTALSARLRLCPQSRFDRLKAGVTGRDQPDQEIYHPGDPEGLLAGHAPWPTTGLKSFQTPVPRKPKTGLASFR